MKEISDGAYKASVFNLSLTRLRAKFINYNLNKLSGKKSTVET